MGTLQYQDIASQPERHLALTPLTPDEFAQWRNAHRRAVGRIHTSLFLLSCNNSPESTGSDNNSGQSLYYRAIQRLYNERRQMTSAMMHITIQEALGGKAVDWMEKVSDEQYGT